VRVAACIAWAGQIKAGSVVKAPLHIVDLYPTLLRLAGASLPQTLPLDGRDAWAAIAQGKASPHKEILLNATPNAGALRVGDWKLVLNGATAEAEGNEANSEARPPAGEPAVELFNLANDPYEKQNLAAQQPGKVKELRARYDKLAAQAAPPKQKPKAPGFKSPKVWGEPQ
jgi:arylsulfatase A-like enzyme